MIQVLNNSWVNFKFHKEHSVSMVAIKIRQRKLTLEQQELNCYSDRWGCCRDRYNGVCFETQEADNKVRLFFF